MDVVDGWRSLLELVGPRLLLPVASALVITLLWALTGWAAFDLGPWPWALGALPVAVLLGARLVDAAIRHRAAESALSEAVAGLRAAGRSLPAEHVGIGIAAIRVSRSRLGGGALADLGSVLDEDTRAQVRAAADPLDALLDAMVAHGADAPAAERARSALQRAGAAAASSSSDAIASGLTSLFLITLPVGLVTTTGWWTFLGVAGVALAFQALDALAERLERPFGPGRAALPVDALHAQAERAVAARGDGA